MQWHSVLTSFAALVFVLSLIAIVALLLRKYGNGNGFTKAQDGDKRLAVKEILHIDAKRKLVLIARDDKEHMLLLAADREMVIEKNIVSGDMAEDIKQGEGA